MEITSRLINKFPIRAFVSKCVVWLLLSCFFSFLIPTYAHAFATDVDKVYCPLQKLWVNKTPVKPKRESNKRSQLDICSTSITKSLFLSDVSANIAQGSLAAIFSNLDDVFFEYVAKGKNAFDRPFRGNNLPKDNSLFQFSDEKSSISSQQNDLTARLVNILTIEVFARPPSVVQCSDFNEPHCITLKKISRNINPRSPPKFLS